VLAWYEDIFDEFIRKKNLEHLDDVKNELVKNRVLMKFNQDGMTGEQIRRSLRALIVDGGFKAEGIIIDGFDFSKSDPENLALIKDMARDLELSIWYSCTVPGDRTRCDKRGVPLALKDFEQTVDVIILLDPKTDHIELSVSKDREAYNPAHMALRLDPKTLLILEE
jgi:hypothetical protein